MLALYQKADALELKGKPGEAARLYEPAVERAGAVYDADHSTTTALMNNLALLYKGMAQYARAEPLYQRSLGTREAKLGQDHPGLAQSLNNLATLYQSMYQATTPPSRPGTAAKRHSTRGCRPDRSPSSKDGPPRASRCTGFPSRRKATGPGPACCPTCTVLTPGGADPVAAPLHAGVEAGTGGRRQGAEVVALGGRPLAGVQPQHLLQVAHRLVPPPRRPQGGGQTQPRPHVRPRLQDAPEAAGVPPEGFRPECPLTGLDPLPVQVEGLLAARGVFGQEDVGEVEAPVTVAGWRSRRRPGRRGRHRWPPTPRPPG
jgi:hypothetical protein